MGEFDILGSVFSEKPSEVKDTTPLPTADELAKAKEERRWKIVAISLDLAVTAFLGFNQNDRLVITDFMDVPKGYETIDCMYSWDSRQLLVRICHPSFDRAPDGEITPRIATRHQVISIPLGHKPWPES